MKKARLDIEGMGRILTVVIFLLLSVAGFGFSVYLFMVANSPFLYVIAAGFLILSILSGFFNVLASYWYYKSFNYKAYLEGIRKKLRPIKSYPTVSVVMPTHDEDVDMIRRNVAALKGLSYQKGRMNLFVLNDSSDPAIKGKIESMCRELGVRFIYRGTNKGYKGGALNNFLKYSNDEFIAIFDADESLKNNNFLKELMPYFQEGNIAYVQTEKRYSKGTFFSDSVDIFDAFFFRFIESARAIDGTAIFSGSCGIIRRSVLDEVGGFPEYAIEDTFFSLESDLKGYRGLFVPKVYAYGKPIKTFSGLVKQQWRYNYGDTQFISYFFRKKGHEKKPGFPTVNYMAHGMGLNYLSIVLILFTIVSTAIVFSTLPFAHIGIKSFSILSLTPLDIAELLGLFAFILSMFAPAILTKMYFKSFKKGVMVFMLNYALAFVRTGAAISAILGMESRLKWNSKWETKSGVGTSIIAAVNKAKVEVAFVAILVFLAAVALMRANISGGIWLLWYGGMFSLAPVFFYKYG